MIEDSASSLKIKKTKIKYEPEYVMYLARGESAAVLMIRDTVDSIASEGKWIDVVSLHAWQHDGLWNFSYVLVEIFKRKIQPKYIENCDHKYITWKTANEDISNQRKEGFAGQKYLVFCSLINKNEGKYKYVDAVWNKTFKRWVPQKWETSSCEIRKKKIWEEPDWTYTVKMVRTVSDKQAQWIVENEETIIKKIESNNGPERIYFKLY